MTKKFNREPDQPIGWKTWTAAWTGDRFAEPNNTVLNLVSKARDETYQGFLTKLFAEAERHCDLAIRAANAGLHVIADKPMSKGKIDQSGHPMER